MRTFLKILIPAFVISLLITGCTEKSIEEFVFKNTLSYKLNGMCGENGFVAQIRHGQCLSWPSST
jgi:hypothetical protein